MAAIEDITKYEKIIKQEIFDCKNPVLLKALKDTGSLDIGFPAHAAEIVGKCIQALMRERHETNVTVQTVNDAISSVDKFEKTDAGEAVHFARDNVIRILSAVWSKGDQIATILGGMSKPDYEAFCRSLNQKYVKIKPMPENANVK